MVSIASIRRTSKNLSQRRSVESILDASTQTSRTVGKDAISMRWAARCLLRDGSRYGVCITDD